MECSVYTRHAVAVQFTIQLDNRQVQKQTIHATTGEPTCFPLESTITGPGICTVTATREPTATGKAYFLVIGEIYTVCELRRPMTSTPEKVSVCTNNP